MKAVMLGACFLIVSLFSWIFCDGFFNDLLFLQDFMFFEKTGNKENDGPGMF